MTDQPNLLPCPFCGGQAELFSGHVACRETGCEMCFSDISDVKFTVAEWNTRADLAPKVRPLEWQTIETAPKDWSTVILAHSDFRQSAVGFYHVARGKWVFLQDTLTIQRPERLTHWMPLPAPPSKATK